MNVDQLLLAICTVAEFFRRSYFILRCFVILEQFIYQPDRCGIPAGISSAMLTYAMVFGEILR